MHPVPFASQYRRRVQVGLFYSLQGDHLPCLPGLPITQEGGREAVTFASTTTSQRTATTTNESKLAQVPSSSTQQARRFF